MSKAKQFYNEAKHSYNREADSDLRDLEKQLREIVDCFVARGYTPRDIAFQLNLEAATYAAEFSIRSRFDLPKTPRYSNETE